VPTLPGVLVGIPLGLALWWVLTIGTMVLPSVWWLLVATLAMLLGVAAFTALPARIEARRAVADVLRAETT
jgi:putative ABC transport system permease protein